MIDNHIYKCGNIEDLSILEGAIKDSIDRVEQDYYGESIEYYREKLTFILKDIKDSIESYIEFAGAMDRLIIGTKCNNQD